MGQRARMRGRGASVLLALAMLVLVGLVGAPAATAASVDVTPFVNCYWDNGDATYTVSLGVDNKAKTTVTVPIGVDNKVSPGAQFRGQPTTFAAGTTNNAWVVTVTAAEVAADINWYLTGHTVSVKTFQQCSSRPVPQQGNALAALAIGALTALVGSAFLGERRRRTRVVV